MRAAVLVLAACGSSPQHASIDDAVVQDVSEPDAPSSHVRPLGTAAVQPSVDCPATAVPTSQCLLVTITCPGIAPLAARVKVTDPSGPVVGAVILGSGGGGGGFYEAFGPDAVSRIIQPLVARGFRVIQRAWNGANGWLDGPGGAVALGCRYATLVDWVHHALHPAGALCVTGNSGGSAEIAYGLTHYGMGDVVDLAIPTSGPPLGQLAYGCLGGAAWDMQCAQLKTCAGGNCELVPPATMAIDYTYGPGTTHCTDRDASFAPQFLADSVVSPDAVLAYPRTQLRFVFGDADCSEAVPLGRLYASSITTDATTTIVRNAPHAVPGFAAGAQQIADDLAAGCILRH